MTMVQQQSQHSSSSSSSSSMDNGDSSSVRVAVRIRPFNSAERQLRAPSRTPQEPIQISQDNPIVTVLPDKKRFTFDYVFGTESTQQDVFDACVPSLLNKFIQGYNATILAYGQTSSGKTSMGIIPRAIRTLFDELNAYKGPNRYQVRVSFLEVYNEELIDLLASEEGPRFPITIREDARGRIYWTGVREVTVRSPSELAQGSWRRQVGHTDMNEKSSRSHAIFSVTLKQERPANSSDRAKEGISINAGLSALGNVISALGDTSRKVAHIPYRDSKLTRLLQDSLGGNSQTLMIACASPASVNVLETLNTLQYANRARNIKNKVSLNEEMSTDIGYLQAQVTKLRAEVKH
ncbi:P-loop containing nucleoside triphosphate hydrolase protein [Syncephalis plumigaleata]|nr:P-loop containing nucleoside triphosphate hydrolase protein [Syncephalis plumigaleata]